MTKILLLLSLLSTVVQADPLEGTLYWGQSVSQASGARNVFRNPAGLGFETELNGFVPTSSVSLGVNQGAVEDFSLAMSWGFFGLGAERLQQGNNRLSRYSLALGIPLKPWLFAGTRFRFGNVNATGQQVANSLDLGVQLRVLPRISFGALASQINTPTVNGVPTSTRYIFGLTIDPIDKLRFRVDADTSSQNFGSQWGYMASAEYQISRGIWLRGGYHKDLKYHVGLNLSFGKTQLINTVQPDTGRQKYILGLESTFHSRPAIFEPESAVRLTFDREIAAEPNEGNLFVSSRPALPDFLAQLKRIRENGNVHLVMLNIERVPMSGADITDLVEELWKLRGAGIEIEAYIGDAGMGEYLLASAANRIFMRPNGQLVLAGLSFQNLFLKGALDKIGISAELLAKGEYKAFPETFTRKSSSETVRRAREQMLKNITQAYLAIASKGGRLTSANWKTVTEQAVIGTEEAIKLNLVNAVGTFNDAKEHYQSVVWFKNSLLEHRDRLSLPPRIAVIYARGDILDGSPGAAGLLGVHPITPEMISNRLDKATSDPRTQAIVLRVDSGGGEIIASQEIADHLSRASKKIPIYVSMGGAAASGGYLISAKAKRIFAQPFTATGSIGVFLGKPNAQELMKKIDVWKEFVTLTPHTDIFSWDRPYTAEQRRIMELRLNQYYGNFVNYVSKARNLGVDKVENAAKGRVWYGEQAKKLGLVDEIGGLFDAVEFAAEEANLGEDYEMWTVTEPAALFDFLSPASLFSKGEQSPTKALFSLLGESQTRALAWMIKISDNPFLYLSSDYEVRF